MVAFLFSTLLVLLMVGVVVYIGRRRPPSQRLTWGEAFVAGIWAWTIMFLVYGVVPHQWLAWADNELEWRSDTIGIPLGPFGGLVRALTPNSWVADNLLAPEGIALPNGRFIITAQVLRDIIASGIYIVFGLAQIYIWFWWQRRGKKAADKPELVSAYGRPLVKRA